MKQSESYVRKNISLAWPLALNAVLMQSMLMIDTLLVAPLGEEALASMGLATALMAFVLGVQFALANGTQLVVGRASGSRNQRDLSTAFWTGLLINIISALFFWSVIFLFGYELVSLVTDNPALLSQAESYLSIIKYIIIATAFTQVSTVYLNGCGNTKVPFKGYLLELPFNALISFVLINGWLSFGGLGLEGAAWGSLAAIFVRLAYLFYSLREEKWLVLCFPSGKSFFSEVRSHFREISPIAANLIMLSVGMSVYQLLYAQLDLYSYVAIMLVFPWLRIGTQFITAWAQASAINISQAIGQKRTKNLKFFVTKSTQVALFISVIIAALFYVLSQSIALIYPNIDPETYMALATIAPLYIFLPIVRTYNTISGHVLRSIGQSVPVLKIHFVTQWLIALPLCAVLILYFDLSVFWAFAMMPIEELLKMSFLYRHVQLSLRDFGRSTVDDMT